ncbi:MAG: glycosyl hydrolase, partial [Chitinophagaceae bacterium]
AKNKKIAFIGPLVKSVREHLGFWSFDWPDDTARIVSLWDGVQAKVGKTAALSYAKGCELTDSSKQGFDEAIATAMQADVIVMAVGETRDMSGEAKSRSNIGLPGVQEELIKAMMATGKPVVVMISAGRPLVFDYTATHAPAILYTWWLGIEAGNAMADVLFGDYNPSGKLPMTFPRSEGQIPIYYNYFNTGRPAKNETDLNYVSSYTDLPNSPRYPFGFGLSYTNFNYGKLSLSTATPKGASIVKARILVTNSGTRDGEEVVQLYIRDITASAIRPMKELKGFQKIFLKAGESREVTFNISTAELMFYNNDLKYDWEPGEFEIMVGTSSTQTQSVKLTWLK